MNGPGQEPACDYPAWHPPLDLELAPGWEHPCSYLPDQQMKSRYFLASEIDGTTYQAFMDAGFRRSGEMIYQPVCRGCRACLPLRVPVRQFMMNKSQRRSLKRNDDLQISRGRPKYSLEKYRLYCRYQREWHARSTSDTSAMDFKQFLYESPTQTVEFEYRNPEGTLLAVGICDMAPTFLSSVYFYFEPGESKRGLGTFGALHELRTALELSIPHYYLGYWVKGCRAMEYKANFQPCEVLYPDGKWRPYVDEAHDDHVPQ
jgi:arginyl-tRNA--protein-N-Asp/Glu arginylyltransferase